MQLLLLLNLAVVFLAGLAKGIIIDGKEPSVSDLWTNVYEVSPITQCTTTELCKMTRFSYSHGYAGVNHMVWGLPRGRECLATGIFGVNGSNRACGLRDCPGFG